MPLVKILKNYENTSGWSAGQILDISNVDTLVKEGNAVLVDGQGNEIEHISTLKQLRKMVTTVQGMEMINSLISRHPEKEDIIRELTEEGVYTEIKEEPKRKNQKVEVKLEDVPERPSVVVTKDEIMAKVAELRKKAESKI